MDSPKTHPKRTVQAQAADAPRRPRRRIAMELLERGRRLRNRAGVLIGVSMGVVALLTVME